MSHIKKFLVTQGLRPARRKKKPHDHLTKDQMWARLQEVVVHAGRLDRIAAALSRAAHTLANDSAHPGAEPLTPSEVRRRAFALRDGAHAICKAVSDMLGRGLS